MKKKQGNSDTISFSISRGEGWNEKYIHRFGTVFIYVTLLAALSRAVERIKGGENEEKRSNNYDIKRKMFEKS